LPLGFGDAEQRIQAGATVTHTSHRNSRAAEYRSAHTAHV
jgi:hypothetical protein